MFEIATRHHLTPIGWITLTAKYDGLTKVEFGKIGSEYGSSKILSQAVMELDEYFMGSRREFTVPLCPSGTKFQMTVWNSLRKIPYGAIPSYSDIADDIGRPSATRAVGMANNKNPLPIFIPCHRVIGGDGSLTGYAGGTDIKRKLLDLELYPDSNNQRNDATGRFDRPAQLHLIQ